METTMGERMNMMHNKFEYITEELKDYDDFMDSKLREDVNLQIVNLTQAIESEARISIPK